MTRNLVLSFDGTGAQIHATGNSNPVLTYELLDLSDPSKQVGYYDPGVGTMAAAGAWSPPARALSLVSGLAFGSGLREKLGEAYRWLMREWSPGDRIFLFGFSRGAYTARALSGLLRAVGILRAGSENLVPYLVSAYARPAGERKVDFRELDVVSHSFAQHHDGHASVPVAYLGAWDTVKSVGLLRWQTTWPWTRQLPVVERVRHAVSVDERRRPFTEYLVTPTSDSRLEEAWFAGVHSDVGGTFTDDARLSTISLKWVIDGAIEAGLLVTPTVYERSCTVTSENARGKVHRTGLLWDLLGTHHRAIPNGASIHDSVRVRLARDPTYRVEVPADVTWVDTGWVSTPDVLRTSGGG
jgi:uncharacterized protein (DUF2235 family)